MNTHKHHNLIVMLFRGSNSHPVQFQSIMKSIDGQQHWQTTASNQNLNITDKKTQSD